MIKVAAVHPESIGAELGLRAGTELVSVNGRLLDDFLDWEFLTADEAFTLLVRQPEGDEVEYDIERSLEDPLGVVLAPPRIRRCANRCDFCFVDGLPPGLREVLYIRDDDYRLSFRYGNFATLTNLKDKDVERIIEYRLSPLYVSVHATDPVVRRYLLRNPTAPAVVPQLRHFADGADRRNAGLTDHPRGHNSQRQTEHNRGEGCTPANIEQGMLQPDHQGHRGQGAEHKCAHRDWQRRRGEMRSCPRTLAAQSDHGQGEAGQGGRGHQRDARPDQPLHQRTEPGRVRCAGLCPALRQRPGAEADPGNAGPQQ